jgi:hypothetical protein
MKHFPQLLGLVSGCSPGPKSAPVRFMCMFSYVQYGCCMLDIAYIVMATNVCCNCIFQIYRLFHLDVACFYLDVAYVTVAIGVCCKCMF